MLEPGTGLTIEECRKNRKEFLHLDFDNDLIDTGFKQGDMSGLSGSAVRAKAWLEEMKPAVLNVAGNRESSSPGIQIFTKEFLELIFS